MKIAFPILLLSTSIVAASAQENRALPPYKWGDGKPKFSLWTDHKPIPGWEIKSFKPGEVSVNFSASPVVTDEAEKNLYVRGENESVYFVYFDRPAYNQIAEIDLDERAVFLGWKFNWGVSEVGLARVRVHTALRQEKPWYNPVVPPLFRPTAGSENFLMDSLMLPTIQAESAGDFTVLNSFDKGGMTLGTLQLVAHTDDLSHLLRYMLSSPKLRENPESFEYPDRWFPELGVISNGTNLTLGHRKAPGEPLVSVEGVTTRTGNNNDGFKDTAKYFREDFVRLCNPSTDHAGSELDDSELHFAARWLMWSQSPLMREVQIEASREILTSKIKRLFSSGVVRPEHTALDVAAAAMLSHWNPKVGRELLRQADVQRAMQEIRSAQDVTRIAWIPRGTNAGILKKRVNAYFAVLGQGRYREELLRHRVELQTDKLVFVR